jgi:hypothetical protein
LPYPPSPDLYAFLAAYAPEVQAIALRLRQLILEIVPASIEQVDRSGKLIGYGFKPTCKDTICVIMPLKAAVNLGFPRGVDLPDPAGLLTGTGKRARHVKITSLQEIDDPRLLALLQFSVMITQGKG